MVGFLVGFIDNTAWISFHSCRLNTSCKGIMTKASGSLPSKSDVRVIIHFLCLKEVGGYKIYSCLDNVFGECVKIHCVSMDREI